MTTVIDGRGMQPPEPLEQTLLALERLAPDDEIRLLLYCQPNPLFNLLAQRGCSWKEDVHPDGTHEVRIRAPRS